jgi:hypothetical protein
MKNKFCLLLLVGFNTYTTSNTLIDNSYFTKKNILFSIVGTATAFVIGKLLCVAYYDYMWPTQSLINYYQTAFKKIEKAITCYKNSYEIDAQMSDWELKEKICTKNTGSYPFITYHTFVIDALYELDFHLNTVHKSWQRIVYRKKYSTDLALLETLTQLELQSLQLQKQLTRMTSLLFLLKNRISLFQEYKDDYYHSKQDKEIEERNNRWETEQKDIIIEKDKQESHILDSFERIEQQIIQFNVDYY